MSVAAWAHEASAPQASATSSARIDLAHQPVVGARELGRAGRDAPFELGVEPLDRGLGGLDVVQVAARHVLPLARAQSGARGARERLGIERPLEQHRIAQLLQRGLRAGRTPPRLAHRQHHERQVGPGRLPRQAGAQRAVEAARERLLGHDRSPTTTRPAPRARRAAGHRRARARPARWRPSRGRAPRPSPCRRATGAARRGARARGEKKRKKVRAWRWSRMLSLFFFRVWSAQLSFACRLRQGKPVGGSYYTRRARDSATLVRRENARRPAPFRSYSPRAGIGAIEEEAGKDAGRWSSTT